MTQSTCAPSSNTSTSPSEPRSGEHAIRDTLRSVALPSAAQSPFGPERKRKREEQPPTIPGQRKASDALPPRPAPPTSRYAPNPDQVATWWDHAEQFFGDSYDRHAAWDAFGADQPRGAA